MSFLKEIVVQKNIRILIWKIDEALSDLKKIVLLSNEQKKEFEKRVPISTKKQYLASRKLIEMVKKNQLNKGFYKSKFKNKKFYYSISHTKSYAVLGVAYSSIGVDIESYRTKILKIKTKFINPNEIYSTRADDIKVITRLWTCKEAIYKCISKNNISFKNDIIVDKFKINSKRGYGKVYLKNKIIKFNLHFINFGNHELTLSYL